MLLVGRNAYLLTCSKSLKESRLTSTEREKIYNRIFAHITQVPQVRIEGVAYIDRDSALKMTQEIFKAYAKQLKWNYEGELLEVYNLISVRARKLFVETWHEDIE